MRDCARSVVTYKARRPQRTKVKREQKEQDKFRCSNMELWGFVLNGHRTYYRVCCWVCACFFLFTVGIQTRYDDGIIETGYRILGSKFRRYNG